MRACRVHAVCYGRLWRLPSTRTYAVVAAGTVILAGVTAATSAIWLPVTVVLAGVAGIAVLSRRQAARLAMELHLVRALLRSRPCCPGPVEVPGLGAAVRAQTGPDGVTQIAAESWLDGVRALGYVLGRDRGFQLDWLRRLAAGRLSEVCGPTTLAVDRDYRALGFAGTAERAVAALDRDELDLLEAFASGVSAALDGDGLPFECRFLGYHPQPWRPVDSVLIGLLFFHGLSWNEEAKRAETVIRRVLPGPVAQFLLAEGPRSDHAVPAGLHRHRAPADRSAGLVRVDPVIAGSNCWAGSGPDGPILACDLHVPLSLPNPLYEVDIRWPGHRVHGLVTAGLPVLVTGSNGRLVWGVTNLSADVVDVIPAPAPAVEPERIRVRGGADVVIDVARAGTAVLSSRSLLGDPVAIRWTGYDPRSFDLRLHRLVHATGVEDAVALLDQAQGIALNVLVADESGRLAHLATGLLPRRTDPGGAAEGYLTGPERPRVVDPPSRVLVSANDAALPDRPYRISYNPDPGHRAQRLRQLLAGRPEADPATTRAMQHDTRADLYAPYRDLAVAALRGRDELLASLLAAWNGHADLDSRPFALLVRLREVLAQRVLSPYLQACREAEPGFRYGFQAVDRPLLAIIGSGDPALLPLEHEDAGWDGFIAACVADAVADLSAGGGSLPTWGQLNRVGLSHPLQPLAPWAGALLGIRARSQPGALHCVRTCVPGFSAVGRAVLRLGPHGMAEFDTPAGQSGHPLSPHYDDRHRDWSTAGPWARRRPRSGCSFVLRAATAPQRQS